MIICNIRRIGNNGEYLKGLRMELKDAVMRLLSHLYIFVKDVDKFDYSLIDIFLAKNDLFFILAIISEHYGYSQN